MKLASILSGIKYDVICGSVDFDVGDICFDSRCVKDNDIFVCLVGVDSDGHNFINDAILGGARCIVVSREVDFCDATVIRVNDTRRVLSLMCSNFFCRPQDSLVKIGITGTKGKTSSSFMIKSILEANGDSVGLIGTNGTFINGVWYDHKNTTPESYFIYRYMRMMVDSGVKYLVMEVSSAALSSHRVDGIFFDYGIFTNLSIDHVGPREHPSFSDYIFSKSLLFRQCRVGIFNSDDSHFVDMTSDCSCSVYTYGKRESDCVFSDIRFINDSSFLGCEFSLNGLINDIFRVSSPGIFSVYNACSSILLCHLLGISNNVIKSGLVGYSVLGRCEVISVNDFKVVIDYAHNKVSMESIIKTMSMYPHNKIITVFGCGGGRSFERRYELGYVSGSLSDFSVVTSDNPRYDDVNLINSDIVKGIVDSHGDYVVITDRRDAILYALDIAGSFDIVLILGKGHERFQEIDGVVYPFDEREIIDEYKGGF